MEAKTIFAEIFAVIIIVLLLGYSSYYFASEELEFSANPRNYNFSVNNTDNNNMQFYPNMRYPNREITYRIYNCEKKKSQDMEDAFGIMENLTILKFNEVSDNEELYITCNETTRFKKNMFIAGEAGPSWTVRAGWYNIILRGEILLMLDSGCERPNIAIHELLHALGFNHSNNPNNIMYPISSCKQTIGEEIPQLINEIYSTESLPDLVVENASAHKHGLFLDINISVRNVGLNNASSAIINIISNEKIIKQIGLEGIEIGKGRIITLTSLLLTKLNADEIIISIDSADRELDKKNNNITLEIIS